MNHPDGKFEKDLLGVIVGLGGNTTQTNILRRLDKTYGYHASMFFNDAVANLEIAGKVLRMSAGGLTTWEAE